MIMKTAVKFFLFVIPIIIINTMVCQAQNENYLLGSNGQNHWVDSVYDKLSLHDKVAQLFFIRAHTNKGLAYEDSVANVILKQHVGGIVFFQGGPVRQAALTNRYQKLTKVPLLVAMDGEWGLGMRLDSTISYPYQMTLGAIQNNSLIYKMGQQIAHDFKRMGVQINFAPDMDINNNPNNPVINYRSFGDNKYNVAEKGIAYMRGMQAGGLLCTAKHFPGHGDTNIDSHIDLPLLPFTRTRLDTLEEYPFRQAVKAGISGIMVAHMDIPALDNTKNLPSSLSKPIVTGVLKDSMGFKGLIVTDAMEMKAVEKYFPGGEADLKAFLAGDDIIELSENSAIGIERIMNAIERREISATELAIKVKKVLAAKYWAGLSVNKPISKSSLVADLNKPECRYLVQQLSDAAVTLLKGNAHALQLYAFEKTAIVCVGATGSTIFQQELSQWYTNSQVFYVPKTATSEQLNSLSAVLSQFSQVYVGIFDSRPRPGSKLDYSPDLKQFVSDLARHQNSVISVFANAYAIAGLPGIENCGALLCCYQVNDELQRSAVRVITQLLKPTGKLPVRVNAYFPYGTGLSL
jgi:beta-glucosidase-like glycosyl hydrolase